MFKCLVLIRRCSTPGTVSARIPTHLWSLASVALILSSLVAVETTDFCWVQYYLKMYRRLKIKWLCKNVFAVNGVHVGNLNFIWKILTQLLKCTFGLFQLIMWYYDVKSSLLQGLGALHCRYILKGHDLIECGNEYKSVCVSKLSYDLCCLILNEGM